MTLCDCESERRMAELAAQEELKVLARLWEAVGKPLESQRLAAYGRELRGIPFGLLELAVSRCLRERTWSNVPAIGEVWAAVRAELGNPPDLQQAIAGWVDARWNSFLVRARFHRNEQVAHEP